MTYTEILIASLGSLSYAEDENRHILGIKTTQPATVAGSTLSGGDLAKQAETKGRFCCHVIECDSEVKYFGTPRGCMYVYMYVCRLWCVRSVPWLVNTFVGL